MKMWNGQDGLFEGNLWYVLKCRLRVPFDVQTSLKYVFSFKSTKWKRDYFGNICCQTKNHQVCGFLNLLDEVLCQTIQLRMFFLLKYYLDFRIYGYWTFMSQNSTRCDNHKSFECGMSLASLWEYSGIGFGIEFGV